MKVVKRNGNLVDFDKNKIYNAIMKAMKNGSGIVKPNIAKKIADEIEEEFSDRDEIRISEIETTVFDKLITKKQKITAKAYESYRAIQEFKRNYTELDKIIEGIVDGTNEEAINENSNKNAYIASTQRDLMAGEYSKDYSRRNLLPANILYAHDEGIIHMHDLDYFMQHIHNCFDVNTKFITSNGMKSFADFKDGDIISVLSLDGKYHQAKVHCYGTQPLYKYTFYNGKKEYTHEVLATENHRWILKDNIETLNLSIGDKLVKAPVIYQQELDFDSLSEKCKLMWCKGFGLGDGTIEYGDKDKDGKNIKANRTRIRLCGDKDLRFLDRFNINGCGIRNTTFENSNDKEVVIYNYHKEIPLFDTVEEITCFLNGLYCADGNITTNENKINFRLQSSKQEVIDFIRQYADVCGLYITKERDVTGEQTNFGTRPYTIAFSFNPDFSYNYTVIDKEFVKEDKVWCLEVEDTHNFILQYGIPTGNCCLVNLKDMLQNGTVINRKMIEKPKSLQTACTVATQAVQQIANGQYGGQTISLAHLAPFVRISFNKYLKKYKNRGCSPEDANTYAMEDLHEEIKAGIQTIQYQINTFSTSNGQAPFLSIFMYISEEPGYEKETAMLIEEMLRQRIQGMKNEAGAYITPAFPKLLYVTDKNNIYPGSEYYYLTELAAECVSKRMMPDFISAKIMRQNYDGEVFPCMGCVEGNEIITYKFKNDLYVESFARMWDRLSKEFIIQHQYSIDNPNLYMDLTNVQIYDTVKGFVNTQRIIRNISNNWVKVHMTNGRILTCTDDHPFATNNGRVLAKDLVQGQTVIINHSQYIGNSHYNWEEDLSWAYGVMLCDGSIASTPNGTFAITGEDDIINKLKSTFDSFYNINCKVKEQHRGVKGEYKEISIPSRKLQYDLIKYFEGISKEDRHIPNILFSMSYLSRLSFLAGMIDADGYINSTSTLSKVQLGSTNKELALQQMALMQSLNMPAYIYENHYDKKHPEKIRYRVECIPSDDLVNSLQCDKKKQLFTNNIRKNSSMNESEVSEIDYIENISMNDYSYDVTTDSDHFEVSGIYSHNCRSFLAPWKDENGNYKWYGRFNQGVVTLNLVDAGLSADKDIDTFWNILDERLNLCYQALMLRHERLENTPLSTSPIHWKYGGLARLKGDNFNELLHNGYSSISLGYAGLYECVMSLIGQSHTTPEGEKLAVKIMQHLRDACDKWKKETGIGFSLYGTPLESTTYKLAKCLKKRFGIIPGVTDHDYVTNSYHVNVRENISAEDKLKFESQFQKISSGGAVSYIETCNLANNIPAVIELMQFMYENIQYAEMNGKFDYCQECGFEGEMQLDDNNEWYCPCCGNRNHEKLNIARRTCGYIGDNFWNIGRTAEIKDRFVHVDNKELNFEE